MFFRHALGCQTETVEIEHLCFFLALGYILLKISLV